MALICLRLLMITAIFSVAYLIIMKAYKIMNKVEKDVIDNVIDDTQKNSEEKKPVYKIQNAAAKRKDTK